MTRLCGSGYGPGLRLTDGPFGGKSTGTALPHMKGAFQPFYAEDFLRHGLSSREDSRFLPLPPPRADELPEDG